MADSKFGDEEDYPAAAAGADVDAADCMISANPKARAILAGFKIRNMIMRDGETGAMLWESADWGPSMFAREKTAHLPASILESKSVSREIEFSSVECMECFRLVQRVFFKGNLIEEWSFEFGFVIPHSTNTWQQTIEAAEYVLPAAMLSGNIVIETQFFEGELLVSKSLVRLYYDA